MSQDMMQALSGSSLLSLSIGTLPAVKAGMNLDANPFASQLALMTGTDAAVTAMFASAPVAPVAGEGDFAAALADIAEPVLAAAPTGDAPAQITPDTPMLKAAPIAVAPAAPIVAALPNEASTSQLIEAALSGAATMTQAAEISAAPRTPEMPGATPASQIFDAPHAAVAQALPHAADVPHLKNLIRVDAPMPIRAQIEPDVESAENVGADGVAPHARPDTVDEGLPGGEATVPFVPASLAPVPAPSPVPQAPVTDLGTTRALTEAARQTPVAQPADTRSGGTQPGIEASTYADRSAAAPAAVTPMPIQAAATVSGAMPAMPVQTTQAISPAAAAVPVAAGAEHVTEVGSAVAVEPPHLRKARLAQAPLEAAQPEIVQPMPHAAAPVAPSAADTRTAAIDASSARSDATTAPAPAAAVAQPRQATPQLLPAGPASPTAPMAMTRDANLSEPAVAQTGEAIETPAFATLQPAGQAQVADTGNRAPTGKLVQAQPQPPVAPAPAADAAAAVTMAMTASAPTQITTPVARSAFSSVTARAPISAATRRTLDAAVPSSRSADALSAQFDLADPTLQPATRTLTAEPLAGLSAEAIPPAWAAALNAVNQPVQQVVGAAAPQAAAQPQVPMHNLAFDAAFVAGIESQITRLIDGGQMVKIQVMPEHLGRIDIEMLAGPDRDQVRIVTEHDAVRDTLASSQQRLEQDLRSQGHRNTEVTVELRQQSTGSQNGSAQQQQQRGQSGTESTLAREGAQRANESGTASDAAPAARRPRGNVRYA